MCSFDKAHKREITINQWRQSSSGLDWQMKLCCKLLFFPFWFLRYDVEHDVECTIFTKSLIKYFDVFLLPTFLPSWKSHSQWFVFLNSLQIHYNSHDRRLNIFLEWWHNSIIFFLHSFRELQIIYLMTSLLWSPAHCITWWLCPEKWASNLYQPVLSSWNLD